jgi:hypothetical protein
MGLRRVKKGLKHHPSVSIGPRKEQKNDDS